MQDPPIGAYGASFATGDFDNDGLEDLAVGAPMNEGRLALTPEAGSVIVCWGEFGDPGRCGFDPESCRNYYDPAGEQAGAHFGAGLGVYPTSDQGDVLVVGAVRQMVDDVQIGSVRGLEFEENGGSRVFRRWWSLESNLPIHQIDTNASFGSEFAAAEFVDTTDIDGYSPDLAIGAPGWDHEYEGVRLGDVGAVEFFRGNGLFEIPQATPGSAVALMEVAPPFHTQISAAVLPARSCMESGAAAPCVGSRFGSALAAGRFDEDASRELSPDLAVGAPGTPCLDCIPAWPSAGRVEILNNLRSASPSLLFIPDVGFRYVDELQHTLLTNPVAEQLEPWTSSAADYAIQPGDGYGASLFSVDLVPTFWAEFDDGHYKDELVVGVPGQDATDLASAPVGTVYSESGGVCFVLFGDAEVLTTETVPEALMATPVASMKQWCLDLADKPAMEGGFNNALLAQSSGRMGTSVAAGRVSQWDPHFQILAGAPGESGGRGSVRALYFDVGWNDGIHFASTPGTVRHVRIEPSAEFQAGTDGIAGTSDDVTVSAFGTAIELHDQNCGGAPDVVVGAPGTELPGGGMDSWGSVEVTSALEHPQMSREWSARYRHEAVFSPTGELEEVELVLTLIESYPNSGYGDGFGFTWSGSNQTSTLWAGGELPNGSEVAVCFPFPWNLMAQRGSIPLMSAGDISDTEGCSIPYDEPDAYTSVGQQWMAFGPPRPWSLPWVNTDDLEVEVDLAPFVDWETLEIFEIGDESSDTVAVNLRLIPTLDSTGAVAEITICPNSVVEITGLPSELFEGSNMNGIDEADCDVPDTWSDGTNVWILKREELDPQGMLDLDCDEAWVY